MKLELKHLAPYLPYGLPFESGYFLVGLCGSDPNKYNQEGFETRMMLMSHEIDGRLDWEAHWNMDRPILRPLSEAINQYQELQGHESYCDAWEEWFSHLDDFEGKLGEANILACPYDLMQVLLEEHIDVFGLIPEGLAIDINTL